MSAFFSGAPALLLKTTSMLFVAPEGDLSFAIFK